MKSLLISTLLVLSLSLQASDTLQFFQGTFDEAMAESEATGKPLLLYFHFDGCGACVKMEKEVFTDPSVQAYYNSAYVVKDINTLIGEGRDVKELYGVTLQPTFKFLNPEGEVVHQLVGVFSPEDFVRAGKVAAEEDHALMALATEYEAGNRDSEFLFNYCRALRDAYTLDSAVIEDYIASLSPAELNSEKTSIFIFEYSFINHNPVFGFDSPALQALIRNQELVYDSYDSTQVANRIMLSLIFDVKRAISNKDRARINEILDYFKTNPPQSSFLMFEELDGRATLYMTVENLVATTELEAAIAFNNEAEIESIIADRLGDPANADADILNEFAFYVYRYSEDEDLLNRAIAWSELAVQKSPGYIELTTYAQLLHKLDRNREALEVINEAIAKGKDEGYGVDREVYLKEQILEGMD